MLTPLYQVHLSLNLFRDHIGHSPRSLFSLRRESVRPLPSTYVFVLLNGYVPHFLFRSRRSHNNFRSARGRGIYFRSCDAFGAHCPLCDHTIAPFLVFNLDANVGHSHHFMSGLTHHFSHREFIGVSRRLHACHQRSTCCRPRVIY